MEPTSTAEFSIGLGHKFFNLFAKVGGTPADANRIAESPDLLRGMLNVLRGFSEFKTKAFPTWRTIQLGGHKTVEKLVEAIVAGDFKIGEWARDILKKVTLAKQSLEVELVVVSVAELGFPAGATRKEIYDRAVSLGLALCPPEVGPQLRLQYADQPLGEWLLVAMEPIAVSDGRLRVFLVGRDGIGRWLGSYSGHPESGWGVDDRWVFSRSKQ